MQKTAKEIEGCTATSCRGELICETFNGFKVIECEAHGYKHVVPVPTPESLVETYQREYYAAEKPDYIQSCLEDAGWWDLVYRERYEILESFLPAGRRRLLDVGSGPGFFLAHGKGRGWEVLGVEPSRQAAEYARSQGLDVVNEFLTPENAARLGEHDAVNLSEVLEHIPNPDLLLQTVHGLLGERGMVCIAVPNDFNAFQEAAVSMQALQKWWVQAPHHLNYFNHATLGKLLERCGFEVVHQESTFPIELFLLMGDTYVGDAPLGRACHKRRKQLELNLERSGLGALKRKVYQSLASAGLGREVVLFGRKK